MKTYLDLADDYIKYQKRECRRDLQSFTQSYIRGFARFIENNQDGQQARQNITTHASSIRPSSTARRVALITEEIGSMTGGRYYAWFIALSLVQLGYDVTVYTTQEPSYLPFFKQYNMPKCVIHSKATLDSLDVEADIYISSPLKGNVAVTKLSAKYKKPCFVMVFDPLPMMKDYMTPYSGWEESVRRIKQADVNIITLCESTTPFVFEWLNKTKEQVYILPPCINSKDLDTAKQSTGPRQDYVVFVSRLVKHKKFEDVLAVVKRADVKLKVISSVSSRQYEHMVKIMGLSDKVEFLIAISDQEKFRIIGQSQALISASNFEGFGMWAAEAVACGTPVVCYDLPTVREIQKMSSAENFYFAKLKNVQDLGDKLIQALAEKKHSTPSHAFDFETMGERLKKMLHYEPRIGVITIALNEQRFIADSLSCVSRCPNVAKIAVVEGAVNLMKDSAQKDGLSRDGTMDQVHSAMKQPQGHKIVYDRYGWANDKAELRNRALELLGDVDYVLIVDADEIWTDEDMGRLVQTCRENPEAGIIKFKFHHFWRSLKQVATGGQWKSMMFRCFRYTDKSLHWASHEKPVVNAAGMSLADIAPSVVSEDTYVYHMGYVKEARDVQDKIDYYRRRDARLNVQDTWTNWKAGDATSPTHGGGTAQVVSFALPKEVLDLQCYDLIK